MAEAAPDKEKPDCFPDPSWACSSCDGKALCPDGLRFRKKIWFLGGLRMADGTNLELALRLDKNVTIPCLELLLLPKEEGAVDEGGRSKQRKTFGYILLEVELVETAAESMPRLFLRGLHVGVEHRGRGMAVLLVSAFLKLCEIVGATPGTRRIDKPLLALVLQRTGFRPERDTVSVQVLKSDTAFPEDQKRSCPEELLLWAAPGIKARQARSFFSHNYLKAQKMRLVSSEAEWPEPPGGLQENCREAFVNTAFSFAPSGEEKQLMEFECAKREFHMEGFCDACFRHTVLEALRAWISRTSNPNSTEERAGKEKGA